MPGRAGRARPFDGAGLGVRVKEATLEKYTRTRRVFETTATAATAATTATTVAPPSSHVMYATARANAF